MRVSTLTPAADRRIRRTSVAAAVVVACGAAAISWSGLASLAQSSGVGPLSPIFPVVIDGMMLTGSLAVLHASLAGLRTWFGWMVTALGAVISVWGNVSSSPVPGATAAIVHGAAPLALLLSLEGCFRVVRHSIAATTAAQARAKAEAAAHRGAEQAEVARASALRTREAAERKRLQRLADAERRRHILAEERRELPAALTDQDKQNILAEAPTTDQALDRALIGGVLAGLPRTRTMPEVARELLRTLPGMDAADWAATDRRVDAPTAADLIAQARDDLGIDADGYPLEGTEGVDLDADAGAGLDADGGFDPELDAGADLDIDAGTDLAVDPADTDDAEGLTAGSSRNEAGSGRGRPADRWDPAAA